MQRLLITLLLIALCASGVRAEDAPVDGATIQVKNAVVVSVSSDASKVGRDIMMAGGNAVDAAVATAFALAVTFPEAGNIGGGGFMLIAPRGGSPTFIDYREIAPAAANENIFASGKPSQYRLVGVPGTVAGLALAHWHFGKLHWKDLLAPAVKLAQDGFELNQDVADGLNEYLAKPGEEAGEMRRVFAKPNGGNWIAGDHLKQPQLAQTLTKIAARGAAAFYDDEVAKAIVDSLKDGLITREDLKHYQAKIRTPVHGTFRGYDIYSAPPPSSGGICVIEMLSMLESLDLRKNDRWSPKTLHLMIETMRRTYADRAKYLGDPEFTPIPPKLMQKDYASKLAATIDQFHASKSESLTGEINLANEGTQTTHFNVIDQDGMAVANTYTLEQRFGGRIMVKGCGFLLNNEMGDFNPRPGITDRNGLIGTTPNQIAPGKRMLSSMTPVIVMKNGAPVMLTGSPGGRAIINTVLCVLVNRLEFGMSPREAVDAPRFTQQWFPDRITGEAGLFKDHSSAIDELKKMGHTFADAPSRQGDTHTIVIENGQIIGVADKRRGGSASGY
jgi:gamma-glutamyltranspeptidase/glutathione hydrolase